jgi:predicted nucleic acid-binding Zn finger protein
MHMRKEVQVLDSVCSSLQQGRGFSEAQKRRLANAFGKRFDNALKALEEGDVKKYLFKPSGRIVWIVVGKEKDYQVIPAANYCSCDDFYYRVIDGGASLCYHILAQKLSEALGRYEYIEDSDNLFAPLMAEWRFIKREWFQDDG